MKTRHESWFWDVQQVHFPFMPKSKKVGHKSIAFACTSSKVSPSPIFWVSQIVREALMRKAQFFLPWTPASIPLIVVKIDLPNHAEKLCLKISVFSKRSRPSNTVSYTPEIRIIYLSTQHQKLWDLDKIYFWNLFHQLIKLDFDKIGLFYFKKIDCSFIINQFDDIFCPLMQALINAWSPSTYIFNIQIDAFL